MMLPPRQLQLSSRFRLTDDAPASGGDEPPPSSTSASQQQEEASAEKKKKKKAKEAGVLQAPAYFQEAEGASASK